MFTAFLKRIEACVETEAVIRISSILLGCMETHKNKDTDLWFQLPPAFVYCLFSSQPINNFSIIQFPCSLVFQPLSFLPLSLKTNENLKTCNVVIIFIYLLIYSAEHKH